MPKKLPKAAASAANAVNKPAARVKATKSVPASTTFTGFAPDAMAFWHELAAEMSKEWFTENKPRYEAEWVAPLTALLDQAAAALADVYRPLKLGAPKVMRIYRDVRFAADKTPYKKHIAGVITLANKAVGESGNTALYVHLGADEEYIGCGCYIFDAAKLAAWRKAVAGKPGEELAALVGKLRKAGYRFDHEGYKKMPRGFPPDHPRAELLKMKGLTAGFPELPSGLLCKPGLASWIIKHATASAPLVRWLHRHVG